MRFDLRRVNAHYLDKVSFHAVGAALAQIQIVFKRAEGIRIAFDPERRFWVALNESAELLQLINRAELQHIAVIFKKLIIGQPQFCAGSERAFLRQQLIQIAKAGSAPFIWAGAVAGQFARECVWPLDRRTRGKLRSTQSGLWTPRRRTVVK